MKNMGTVGENGADPAASVAQVVPPSANGQSSIPEKRVLNVENSEWSYSWLICGVCGLGAGNEEGNGMMRGGGAMDVEDEEEHPTRPENAEGGDSAAAGGGALSRLSGFGSSIFGKVKTLLSPLGRGERRPSSHDRVAALLGCKGCYLAGHSASLSASSQLD